MGLGKEARARPEHGSEDRYSGLEPGVRALVGGVSVMSSFWVPFRGAGWYPPEWYPEGKRLDPRAG